MRIGADLATWPVVAAIIAPCCSRSTSATPRPTSAPSTASAWSSTGASRPASGATGDELAERIAGLFSLCGMSFGDVDAVCVSSVVPPLGSQYEQLTERYLDADCLTIGPGVKTGMPIRIENPLEVGADRLVNAIAAYERFGERLRLVDFGTGINIDAVSAEGEYLGGAIGPGLAALAQRPDRTRGPDPPDRPRRAGGRRSAARPARRSSPASSSASPA